MGRVWRDERTETFTKCSTFYRTPLHCIYQDTAIDILIHISRRFIYGGSVDNESVLAQIMAGRRFRVIMPQYFMIFEYNFCPAPFI